MYNFEEIYQLKSCFREKKLYHRLLTDMCCGFDDSLFTHSRPLPVFLAITSYIFFRFPLKANKQMQFLSWEVLTYNGTRTYFARNLIYLE